jgi:uncharacterized membrane protein YccC
MASSYLQEKISVGATPVLLAPHRTGDYSRHWIRPHLSRNLRVDLSILGFLRFPRRREAEFVLRTLPQELRAAPVQGEPTRWVADPTRLRRMCEAAVRALIALPAGTPSLRLLADHTAEALAGISHSLNGLALLVGDPARPVPRRRGLRLRVPDWLPSLVNAGRASVTIAAVELFWIITAWPNGAGAITFAAIGVILFSPRTD